MGSGIIDDLINCFVFPDYKHIRNPQTRRHNLVASCQRIKYVIVLALIFLNSVYNFVDNLCISHKKLLINPWNYIFRANSAWKSSLYPCLNKGAIGLAVKYGIMR